MKRILTQKINSCDKCPFLESIDGFASHQFHCKKIPKSKTDTYTNNIYGDRKSVRMSKDIMKTWFNHFCPLPKLDKEVKT